MCCPPESPALCCVGKFKAQGELNSRIREGSLTAPLVTGGGVLLHVFVRPGRQHPSGLERCVVCRPVGGLVADLWPLRFTRAPRLPARWGWFVQSSPLPGIHSVTTGRETDQSVLHVDLLAQPWTEQLTGLRL